jgi:uncharacterized membrane protein YhhN
MATALFILTLALALIDWLAVWRSWKRVEWFAKPATLLALIAWFSFVGQWSSALAWFGVALILSLIGDIALLLPRRYFITGLAAFLAAHLAYVVGFNPGLPPVNVISILVLAAVAGLFILFVRPIVMMVAQNPHSARLRIPVLIYGFVLSLMLISALLTLVRQDWPLLAASLAALGGSLFYCSDLLLAFDRFGKPAPNGRVFVHIAYHLGQIALAGGALLRFVQ